MKRIVILIDGTWCNEDSPFDTNIGKLDPRNPKISPPLIKAEAADRTLQLAFYHTGVGSEPEFLTHWLGGAIGLGLKKIVQDGYGTIVKNYDDGDELYLIGFSRGAYAVRALAGLIGASGIQRREDPQTFETAWSHYRVSPGVREAGQSAGGSSGAAIEVLRQHAEPGL